MSAIFPKVQGKEVLKAFSDDYLTKTAKKLDFFCLKQKSLVGTQLSTILYRGLNFLLFDPPLQCVERERKNLLLGGGSKCYRGGAFQHRRQRRRLSKTAGGAVVVVKVSLTAASAAEVKPLVLLVVVIFSSTKAAAEAELLVIVGGGKARPAARCGWCGLFFENNFGEF